MKVNNSTEVTESQPIDQSEEEVLEEQVSAKEETGRGAKEQPKKESIAEESFMGKNFDPNSIKDPNLQKAYKQMQAEWTKDNQEISKIKTEHQQLSQWKKDLESNPYFQQWAEDMARLAKYQQAGSPDFSNMTEDERVNYLVEQKVNAILDQRINPRLQSAEQERAAAKVEKFLVENPEAKAHSAEIADVMKQHPTVDMPTAWKFVKAEFARDDARKEVLGEMEVKEEANLELPGKQPSQPARKKKMSVEEAAELAERQTGLKW